MIGRGLLVFVAVGVLSGCAMNNDMMNNDFPAVAVSAPPADLVGIWTGSMGPYLATMKIEADGSGLMCSSWNGRDSVGRLKFDGRQLRSQDGARLDIKSLTPQRMVAHAAYFGGADYIMHRDDQKRSAAPYCVQQL